jgi:bifunctional UDP-N-acetylglucosamine pyrophosphorylase / glucosamine-1-phosphate N-acetyltransferase
MSAPVAIVLAAGKGTRMKSELPKVLIPVAGRPMIEYVLDALAAGGIDSIIAVVGYRADLVRSTLAQRKGLTFVEQTQQLGTGHAVMVAREALAGHDGPVLIVTGDSPMMQGDSLRTLLAEFVKSRPACFIGTGYRENPFGLGRVVRDDQGRFVAIVEEKDATPDERKITEVSVSCYIFDCRELLFALDQISDQNSQGEYYITDCPGVLKAAGKDVRALPVLKPREMLGVNTPEELAVVEAQLINPSIQP